LAFIPQIKSAFIRGVNLGMSDIPNYVAIRYARRFYGKFEDPRGKEFKLTNIKVNELISQQAVDVSLYFAQETLNGYALEQPLTKYHFGDNIDISAARIIDLSQECSPILPLLTAQERAQINQSEIYPVRLNGKDYYHLKALDDGDFIGIDVNNRIYLITHSPFDIKLLERHKLVELL